MRLRNWLLAGTSLTLLALAPLGAARAQDASDPALQAAYQAYQADQNDDTKQKLTEACIAAGFQSLDDCISALTGTAPVEETAPPADSSEEAPPPEPSSEEAAPAPEQPVTETPSSEEQAAPVEPSSEEPAPVEPSSEEAAPVQQETVASSEEPMSSEEAAPAPSSEEAAPAPSNESPDMLAQLTAAVDLYNAGVAELDAGNADGQAKVDQAQAQIDTICTGAGFANSTDCLAQFGLTLNPLPPKPGEPTASSSEQPAAPTDQSSEQPISELPNASEVVDPNAVEPLPSDVTSEEAAPILDSAKDAENVTDQPSSEQPTDQSSSSEQPTEEQPPSPPPTDDQQAQADIQPPPPEDLSTVNEEGQKKPSDFVFVEPTPPEDVKVVQKPKNDKGGFVFQIGINIYINNPRQERDRYYDPRHDQIYYEDLSRGRTREVIERPDGTRIVTIYDRYGDVLQRSKILPNGREIYLATYDPRDDNDLGHWRDPGDDLPPLRLTIRASDYILDADTADEDQVETFLDQPPVEQVRRIYTIDEVKRSARLRDSVRRLEVGGLTFDTGKATISRDQVGALSKVAKAMQTLLDRNPGEVFLIEGHTDAVGSDVSNLVLSDQRAATVARILTDFYEIPAENLVTQGYGERYLKVKTEGPEALNRRVTIKRITPLVTYEAANNN